MRLYTGAGLPNPDVVHLYQAETGTEACAERVQLDVRRRRHVHLRKCRDLPIPR